MLSLQLDKFRQTNFVFSRELSELKFEVSTVKEQLTRSEEDLKLAEKSNSKLKSKLQKLKRAKRAKTNGSFVESSSQHNHSENIFQHTPKIASLASNNESALFTPKINKPSNSNLIDLEELPPKFNPVTPDLFFDSPATEVRKACEENKVKIVKMSSAAKAIKRKVNI